MEPGVAPLRVSVEDEINGKGQQRNPQDIGKNDVHGQITTHQEYPVAEPFGGRNRFRRDKEKPGGTQRESYDAN